MQKKLEKLSLFITLLLVILSVVVGVMDYFEDQYQNVVDTAKEEWSQTYANISLLTDKGIIKHCVKPSEHLFINMSKEGLNGECGMSGVAFNQDQGCYEFYTYGEQVKGSELAKQIIVFTEENKLNDLKSLKEMYPIYSLLFFLKWVLLISCLLIGFIAFKSFKKLF
jgi:hypothetical protein